MRILIVSQHFWPESFRINTLADALQSSGASVTVLTGLPNYPGGSVFPGYTGPAFRRETRPSGVEVLRVPIIPRGKGRALSLVVNYLSFIASATLFGPWLLRRRSIDAIFVYATSPVLQALPAIALKRIKRASLVTWVQDLWPESLESTGFVKNKYVLRLVDLVVRWIYRQNDLLLGQSRAFVDVIRRKSGGTEVEYFPNPGEPDAAPADAVAGPSLTLPPGFNVVFAGSLGTVQALETILDAADMLRAEPAVRFVIVGSGRRSAWLERETVARSATNVMLPGRFPPAAMPAIYKQATALLVSLNRSEILSQTIPAKVQTYLAAGRPVIASLDGEGAALVIEAGAGLASPAEDARGLANSVLTLKALSEVERATMGAAARRFYELNFRPDALALQLTATFRSLGA